MYISIEASIGVGKSTLLPLLAQELDLVPVEEDLSEGGEFLEALAEFNEDRTKALKLQLTINKYRNDLAKSHLLGTFLVERSMLSDIVFAKVMVNSGFLTKGDYNLYLAMAKENILTNPPRMAVYLACDPTVAYTRMRSRNRDAEDTIELEYLVDLEDAHENLLTDLCDELDIPLLRIEYTEFGDPQDIAKSIEIMETMIQQKETA